MECIVTTVRGIVLDIIWTSKGLELGRTEGVNNDFSANSSIQFRSTYAISQLYTTDEGRIYYCVVFINATSPVTVNKSVTLSLSGTYVSMYLVQPLCIINTYDFP